MLAVTGGTAAALRAGTALGLLPGTAAAASLDLRAAGQQRRIVILGGGLSGLTVAYELGLRGYDCTILEASHRCGGRIFTVRHGDLIDEIGNRQYCEFDDEPHMYFNAGAARIPSTHRNLLAYCRKLNVDLEVFINENKTSWVQDRDMLGGQRIRNIDYTTHMKGFMAELMAKALSQEDLNAPFTDSEAETLLGLIRSFGDLSTGDLYQGSLRAGYAAGGFLDQGVQKDLIALRDLLKTPLGGMLISANEGETGPILLQPTGGMDRITHGFLAHVGDRVRYRAMVASVQVRDTGVDISYDQNGVRHTLEADCCFNCIPSHLVTGLDHNFPADYVRALKFVRRGEAYKAAFQAKRRFWEEEDIYGGISYMNTPSLQVWYPTHGIHKEKGIVLGAYDYSGGMYHTRMNQQQRVEAHLSDGEKLHPGYRQLVERPVTVAWHRMNHMLGFSARWRPSFNVGWNTEAESHYQILRQPVNGRHYLIGDQMSKHSAWQESAILSAHWALADFDQRMHSGQA